MLQSSPESQGIKDSKEMASNNYPLNVDSESELYEVEEILDRRPYGNGHMYLIRWQNFPDPKDYTWEPVSHLGSIKGMIKRFNAAYDKKSSDKVRQKRQKSSDGRREDEDNSQEENDKRRKLKVENKITSKHLPKKEKKIVKVKQGQMKKPSQKNKDKIQSVDNVKKITVKQVVVYQNKHTNNDNGKIWEKQGRSLGRIHKHFYEDGQLLFNVNVNNEQELVCGTVYLTLGELAMDYEEKIIEYMQNWSKNSLIQELQRKTESFKSLEKYWSEIQ